MDSISQCRFTQKSIVLEECQRKDGQSVSDDRKSILGFTIGIVLIVLVELNEFYKTHKGEGKNERNGSKCNKCSNEGKGD